MAGVNKGTEKASYNTRRLSGISLSANKSTKLRPGESRVIVAVRCRPMSEKEISDGHRSIVEFEGSNRVIVHDTSETPSDQLGTKSGERKNYSHVFEFDALFGQDSSQGQVYDQVCRSIVDSVLEGYNGTIFAYGQTGTGKTYTMEGVMGRLNTGSKQHQVNAKQANILSNLKDDQQSVGIIPRAFQQIFDHVAKNTDTQYLIRASYLEIYQEDIHDLLRKDRSIKLELHERPEVGVYVKDLTSFVCKSVTEMERVMRVGNQNRKVGATDMNEHSSRSHAIFMITVEQQSAGPRSTITADGNKNEQSSQERVIRLGKLNLVDLAGSERQRKTNSFGQRQRESIKINLSLSALGNVINSLMKKHTQQSNNNTIADIGFTPYRDSKLTRLLQDSLGGNAMTLMIANIGPASYNYDETINTLNYASRAKCIRNRPKLNEDPKDALLRELQREIYDLRSKLAAMSGTSRLESRSTEKNVMKEFIDQAKVETELEELRRKLSSLESKLLNGRLTSGAGNDTGGSLDENFLQGYTHEQERELEKSRAELADQASREKAIQDELEKREEAELVAKQSFSSAQQEVDAKKKLIRQILLKIKLKRQQIEATQQAYRVELDELDQLQYVLQKELKLKCLIMDNFIANAHVDHLLPRIVYDERKSSCSVTPIDLPLEHCKLNDPDLDFEAFWQPSVNGLRPKSEFEIIGETINPGNIRYKYENLIEPKLDIPKHERARLLRETTNEIENDDDQFLNSSALQTLVDKALSQREADIVI